MTEQEFLSELCNKTHCGLLLDYLQPVLLLVASFYIAWVFFSSGLTKLRDWESTVLLFEYEYSAGWIQVLI